MFRHFILCVLLVSVTTARGLAIVKRSPEEHVPHEGRFDDIEDLDESDYPPLRGIEPALPPHLRYLEATPTELHIARKNTGTALEPVDENRSASARKLIEDNSTFDVTSGNITINDQNIATTGTVGGDYSEFNSTQTLGTALPETTITMNASPTKVTDVTSVSTSKMIPLKRNISNRQPGRSLSNRQPISRSTTIRYVNDTNKSRDERREELIENTKSGEKVANSRNEDTFDPFQHHHIVENKGATQTPEKLSVVTENQDDVVDGFMNRIQDHWVQFVQQMKHSVMDVWQTITSRIMNSLENFSVSTN